MADPITEEAEEYLKELYYDPEVVGSLSTPDNLFKAVEKAGNKYNLTLEQITNFLKSNEVYTVFKRRPNKIKKYPKFVVKDLDSAWFSDMAHYDRYAEFNEINGVKYRFLLVCVDALSKMTFVSKLETASGSDLVKGFKDIFTKSNRRCQMLITDRGSNYSSQIFKTFLDREGVKLSLLVPPSKSFLAERKIRSIGEKLHKLYYLHQDRRWVDKIDKIVDTMNRTYNRTLKGYPYKVNKQNAFEYFVKQYFPNKKMTAKEKTDVNRLKPFLLNIGDYVRIESYRHVFRKAYRENYTIEFFKISRRYHRGIFPIYKVADIMSEELEGTFREEELQKIVFKEDQTYKIDEIKQTKYKYNRKTKKREKWVYVSWYGWNNPKFNSWIPAASIQDYKSTI